MRLCIVQPNLNGLSETFIRQHDERLPGVCGVIYWSRALPWSDGAPVLSQRRPAQLIRGARRRLTGQPWQWEIDHGFATAFRRCQANVVLAEYGTMAVRALAGCRLANIPLVVHFHGYDASINEILEQHAAQYRELFDQAAAVIAVSHAMRRRLIELGCQKDKVIYNPYGIDPQRFQGASPEQSEVRYLAVGRFVEKKAPQLTLAAFRKVLDELPEARLRMIGDGSLLAACRDLAIGLDMAHAVTFLGPQPHDVVQREMRAARAFVQHSVTAASGDSEGTPVAILEAGSMGLPVVATRHAGIPDVVVEGETGLLVDERDVAGMAQQMLTLGRDPQLAGQLGQKAAAHIRHYYTMEQSLSRLSRVLQAAALGDDITLLRRDLEAELPAARLHAVAPG